MTFKKFKILLIANAFLFALRIFLRDIFTGQIPETMVASGKGIIADMVMSWPVIVIVFVKWFSSFYPILYLVALLCLFQKKRYSPYFYLGTIVANYLFLMIPIFNFTLLNNYELILVGFQHTIEGAILFAVFFGPFKHVFIEVKRQSNHMEILNKIVAVFVIVLVIVSLSLFLGINGFWKIPSLLNSSDEFAVKLFNIDENEAAPKLIENSCIKLHTEQGWKVKCSESSAFITRSLDLGRSTDAMLSFIYLNFRPKTESNEGMITDFEEFVKQKVEADLTGRNIDDSKMDYYRFCGNKTITPEGLEVDVESGYVSIYFEFDSKEVRGFFRGDLDDEQDFWKMMESINWK